MYTSACTGDVLRCVIRSNYPYESWCFKPLINHIAFAWCAMQYYLCKYFTNENVYLNSNCIAASFTPQPIVQGQGCNFRDDSSNHRQFPFLQHLSRLRIFSPNQTNSLRLKRLSSLVFSYKPCVSVNHFCFFLPIRLVYSTAALNEIFIALSECWQIFLTYWTEIRHQLSTASMFKQAASRGRMCWI